MEMGRRNCCGLMPAASRGPPWHENRKKARCRRLPLGRWVVAGPSLSAASSHGFHEARGRRRHETRCFLDRVSWGSFLGQILSGEVSISTACIRRPQSWTDHTRSPHHNSFNFTVTASINTNLSIRFLPFYFLFSSVRHTITPTPNLSPSDSSPRLLFFLRRASHSPHQHPT